MVAFLTALLVFASELLADAGSSAAIDRLLATIMGAVLAFIALGIGRWILVRRARAGEADVPPGQTDDVPG